MKNFTGCEMSGMSGNYLITTSEWFYAPDGKLYKAVWGNVEIVEDVILGIKTNRNSVNWYAKVGSEQNHIIVAGCQVNYAIRCENVPNTEPQDDWLADATNGVKIYKRPTTIYIAQ